MAGFGRMNKKSGRAGTGKGRRHFFADMARLAHAHHHHFTLTGVDQGAGAGEIVVNILIELFQTFALNAQYGFPRLLEIKCCWLLI